MATGTSLVDQMRRDPRIAAIQRQRGNSGRITGAELRALGYDVSDHMVLHFGGRAGSGYLSDQAATRDDIQAIQAQMLADPRIQAITAERGMGPGGQITGPELRALGYDVPERFVLNFGGRSGPGVLSDGLTSQASIATAIAAGSALGVAGAAGAFGGAAGAVGGAPVAGGAAPVAGGAAGAGGSSVMGISPNFAAEVTGAGGSSLMDIPANFAEQVARSNGYTGGSSGVMDWLRNNIDLPGVASALGGASAAAGAERYNQNWYNAQKDNTLALLARDQFNSDLQGAQSTFDRNLLGAQSLYDRNRTQQRDIFDTGLQSATFGREGQSREMRQGMLAGLIGGAQDAKITPGNPNIAARMPTMTGGARPSMLSGGAKDSVLGLLGRPQVAAPTYTPPSPYAAPVGYVPPAGYQKPTLSTWEDEGAAEKGLGIASLIARLAGPRR